MTDKDLRYAVRGLIKRPGFTITAILTIALGIGASSAIFSVVNAVLLNPLPYFAPDRLSLVWTDLSNRNVRDFPSTAGDFADMREQGTAFQGLAAVFTFRQSLTGDGNRPEQVGISLATPNLFSVLGLKVALGRDFREDDAVPQPPPPASAPGAPPVAAPPPLPTMAILSDEFWRRRYGSDPAVIGKIIQLDGASALVVGVLQPGAQLLYPPKANIERRPDIYTANRIGLDSAARVDHFLRVIGRLKPKATVAQAQTQMERLSADLRQRFPLKQTSGLALRVEPMQKNLVAAVQPAVLALMGAVLFVLLIACANVANLLLVRASWREREFALRSALGGSQWRLIRGLLAESLVLAAGGGAAGLVLAQLGVQVLTALGPTTLPRLDTVRIDVTVLGFAALATVAAAFLFGMVPALRASRPDVLEVLKPSGRSHGVRTGKWFRNGVVMAEVALSFILLIGSGLMIRSFLALIRTDLGFDPKGLLTFELRPAGLRQQQARVVYEQRMQERLKAIPGVTAITAASNLPLDGSDASVRWGTAAAMADPTRFRQGQFFFVQKDYFQVMGTRLLAGRNFMLADILPPADPMPGAPPGPPRADPAVVDQSLVARAFPGQPVAAALGQLIMVRIAGVGLEPFPYRIVGVVEHQRHTTLSEDERESIYVTGPVAHGKWVVRTIGGDPMRLAAQVDRAIAEVDPLTPTGEFKPMTAFVDRVIAPTRFALVLIGVFAVIAVLLAGVGLYGVLSSVVRQRTAEIGVRMALGARRENIFGLVIRQGMRLSTAGIVLGVLGALALTRVMTSMLVGVKATDPATFVGVGLLFAAITAIACWLPARRAAGLEPTAALREE
jgi:predicted permease